MSDSSLTQVDEREAQAWEAVKGVPARSAHQLGFIAGVDHVESRLAEAEARAEGHREALARIANLSATRQFIPTAFGGFLRDAAVLEDAVALARAALRPSSGENP